MEPMSVLGGGGSRGHSDLPWLDLLSAKCYQGYWTPNHWSIKGSTHTLNKNETAEPSGATGPHTVRCSSLGGSAGMEDCFCRSFAHMVLGYSLFLFGTLHCTSDDGKPLSLKVWEQNVWQKLLRYPQSSHFRGPEPRVEVLPLQMPALSKVISREGAVSVWCTMGSPVVYVPVGDGRELWLPSRSWSVTMM